MSTPTSLEALLALVPGIAGAAVAYSVFRLSVAQREDAWLRSLWEFHQAFWQDKDMAQVRAWIASDEAYLDIKPILARRVALFQPDAPPDAPALSMDEYGVLELIDRYAALLLGYSKIAPKDHAEHGKTKRRLFDEYWINEISEKRRPEMRAYLNRFFPDLFSAG